MADALREDPDHCPHTVGDVRCLECGRKAKLRRMAGSEAKPTRLARVIAAKGNRCWYCRAQAETVDHLIPLSKGGTSHMSNLVPASGRNAGSAQPTLACEPRAPSG